MSMGVMICMHPKILRELGAIITKVLTLNFGTVKIV